MHRFTLALIFLTLPFVGLSQSDTPMFPGKIAYTYNAGQLHILDLETGQLDIFNRNSGLEQMLRPAWNPSGTLIAADTELMTLAPLTDQRTQLELGSNRSFPSWHPTENKIVYSVRGEGLGIYDFDTQAETIVSLPIIVTHPEWHPNRNELILTGNVRGDNQFDEATFRLDLICLENNNCSESLVKLNSISNRRDPSWNSSGEYILLLEERNVVKYVTLVVDVDGKIIREVSHPDIETSKSPKWGPCDRYVMLTQRFPDQQSELYIVDLMTDEFTQISKDGSGSADWWWDADEIDCSGFDLASTLDE